MAGMKREVLNGLKRCKEDLQDIIDIIDTMNESKVEEIYGEVMDMTYDVDNDITELDAFLINWLADEEEGL